MKRFGMILLVVVLVAALALPIILSNTAKASGWKSEGFTQTGTEDAPLWTVGTDAERCRMVFDQKLNGFNGILTGGTIKYEQLAEDNKATAVLSVRIPATPEQKIMIRIHWSEGKILTRGEFYEASVDVWKVLFDSKTWRACGGNTISYRFCTVADSGLTSFELTAQDGTVLFETEFNMEVLGENFYGNSFEVSLESEVGCGYFTCWDLYAGSCIQTIAPQELTPSAGWKLSGTDDAPVFILHSNNARQTVSFDSLPETGAFRFTGALQLGEGAIAGLRVKDGAKGIYVRLLRVNDTLCVLPYLEESDEWSLVASGDAIAIPEIDRMTFSLSGGETAESFLLSVSAGEEILFSAEIPCSGFGSPTGIYAESEVCDGTIVFSDLTVKEVDG